MTESRPLTTRIGRLAALAALAIIPGSCERQPSATATTQNRSDPSHAPPQDAPFPAPFPDAAHLRLFVQTGYSGDRVVMRRAAGTELNPEQRRVFESLLTRHTVQPEDMIAMCFEPHHFFRYFDQSGKAVGEISVCFCCAGIALSGKSTMRFSKGQELSTDYRKLKAFVRSLGEPTDVLCGSNG